MEKKYLALIFGYPIIIAAAAGYWLNAKIEEGFAVRPPVAVIDEAKFVAENLEQGADAGDLEALMVRSEGAAQKLSEHGYVVFRRQQVFSAPMSIEAKP